MDSMCTWNLEDIVALTFIKKMSYKAKREIVSKYNSLYEYLNDDEPPSKFDSNVNDIIGIVNEAKKQLDLCEKNKIRIVTYWDEIYPSLLKKIVYPPNILFVKGELQNQDAVSISVVGTRRNSYYGKRSAERFVKSFVNHGIIITSGMAIGIDSTAHRACINENGITYAVIGCGIDKISGTALSLANNIIEKNGAIISEYPCGTVARPQFFPQRNRIISGLSIATLVVESRSSGGALITAKFAYDEGREVFAVPGSIESETSTGCNEWIAGNGSSGFFKAGCAYSPDYMLSELNIINKDIPVVKTEEKIQFDTASEQKVYDNIFAEPISIDDLQEVTKLDISELLTTLMKLNFGGFIEELPGKLYIKKVN